MRKIGIMADSHSGILKKEAEELDIHVLPMPFYLNGELFQEDLNFSRKGFYEKLREGADVSTSQPSPQEVMEMWDEMLSSYEHAPQFKQARLPPIRFTIFSSGTSTSIA